MIPLKMPDIWPQRFLLPNQRFSSCIAGQTICGTFDFRIIPSSCCRWWRWSRPLVAQTQTASAHRASVRCLCPMANQIIYDSIGWADPPRGVLAMTQWSKNNRTVIFNLAWRRLKPWRRILSQSLAPSVVPGALQRIDSIELHHGPHALPLAWLLLGWLASRLDWKPQKGVATGKQLVWQFASSSGPIRIEVHRRDEGRPNIDRMRIAWRSGDGQPGSHADYRHEGHHIRYCPGDAELWPSSIPTVEQRLEQMVAAQLAHRAGDALFTASIAFSEAMAKVFKSDSV
ncbi:MULTISPECIES: OpcA/G6PD domain-containing protein [Thiorhodovibrio]|uniref:OpcA/G6PD domain-containing protein n=1 Tax=Thiorhodovibrio TaxID=61593 RepID=UPI002B25FD15|nr:OpcA/G6PD domain-containing protein [Thiorhodovibrio litoralis]